ncbi:MAG TPA: hypothetical protein VLV78_17425 [Thermoanaerobaculia bacterium]|nr:hypothetical protein [Thermoanaerobaculia bacterium]
MRPGQNHRGSDDEQSHSPSGQVAFDQEETLTQRPEDFDENYEEFSDDPEASPDDRRHDPLRRKW